MSGYNASPNELKALRREIRREARRGGDTVLANPFMKAATLDDASLAALCDGLAPDELKLLDVQLAAFGCPRPTSAKP